MGIALLIKNGFAHRDPPEPVLHDVVGGNMQLAILTRDCQKLGLRLVAILALPEAVSPAAEQGRYTCQFPVAGDDPVELGPIEKVIVGDVSHFRTQVQRTQKAVGEAAARSIVPENAVPIRGEKEW